MSEQDSLGDIIAKIYYEVAPQDIDVIPRLMEKGLDTVFLCNHGAGRSFGAAEQASYVGIHAVYLSGGLRDLSKMSEAEREEILEKLAAVPYLYIVTKPREAAEYQSVVDQLNKLRKEKEIAPVVIQEDRAVIFAARLKDKRD